MCVCETRRNICYLSIGVINENIVGQQMYHIGRYFPKHMASLTIVAKYGLCNNHWEIPTYPGFKHIGNIPNYVGTFFFR